MKQNDGFAKDINPDISCEILAGLVVKVGYDNYLENEDAWKSSQERHIAVNGNFIGI